LLLKQASQIAQLEIAAGMAQAQAHIAWMRTQRMLYSESTTFFALALMSTCFLFWLYWLEMKRSRSLQAFFASVTHELRTPLTSIRLQAESIAENFSAASSTDDSQSLLVKRLLEDTTRLEGQVERTLELARLEGGGPVFMQPLRLSPWLARLTKSWQESCGTRAVFNIQVDDLIVDADPTALQVIFKNIFENSLKHAKKDPLQISIKAKSERGRIRISFRDDGQGYPGQESDLGKLFFRGASSQGSGVGLYLVKMLMKRMQGRARFKNENGFVTELELKEGAHG
jgi:signal transduction histidine kinase